MLRNMNIDKEPIIGTVVSLYSPELKKSMGLGVVTGFRKHFNMVKTEVKWQTQLDPIVFDMAAYVIPFEDYICLNNGTKEWREVKDIFVTPEMF